MTKKHYSDCAVHNEPAYPAGDCDCGGYEDSSEIEALRAENARLREALKPFADKADHHTQGAHWMDAIFTVDECRAARVAIGERDD